MLNKSAGVRNVLARRHIERGRGSRSWLTIYLSHREGGPDYYLVCMGAGEG